MIQDVPQNMSESVIYMRINKYQYHTSKVNSDSHIVDVPEDIIDSVTSRFWLQKAIDPVQSITKNLVTAIDSQRCLDSVR